jgi:hypothetical protein
MKRDSFDIDQIATNIAAKVSRKFEHYGVKSLQCSVEVNDTISSYIANHFTLLANAKDLNTVVIADTLRSFLNSHTKRYSVLTSSAGGTLSPGFRFRKNLKLYLLQIATLNMVRYRINRGWSYLALTIIDNNTGHSVYLGFSKRYLPPHQEVTTNKQIEQIMHDFFESQLTKANLK